MANSGFSNGSGNGFGHANGGAEATRDLNAELESDFTTMTKRYEQYVAFGQEQSKFITDVYARYEYLHEQHQLLVYKRNIERTETSAWQAEKLQYEKWFKNMQRAMAENPFVVILIDGDGMIFANEFLRGGDEGGRRAAAQLSAAIRDYIENEAKDVPFRARVICRIYANVRGLADILVRTGIVGEAEHFEHFMRGFTRGNPLFDFIDVGAGKDRADRKIIELFKIYSEDVHCRRILIGCSHDNGYARLLEEDSHQHELINKVVLLEGVPFEKELLALPYNTKKFPGLFRESKINAWGSSVPQRALTPAEPPQVASNYLNAFSGLPPRFPPRVRPRSDPVTENPLPATPSIGLSRSPSSSTVDSEGHKARTISWAARAAAPAPPKADVPKYKPIQREEGISRNRAGQRVDPPCKVFDKMEINRVKKLKMCNVHFLRQECPFIDNCSHVHAYNPTMDELKTLRLVARMAPCQYGSGCQDIRCMYGHRCPAPPARTHVKGTKSCTFGEACKFPVELHDIDTNVVKTLVIR